MMLDSFGFALLRYVIGPGNSRHNLNQSNVKLKPTTTWSLAFSRALRRLPVSTLCSHWLIIMVTFFLIGSCHHFGFGFLVFLIEKCSTIGNSDKFGFFVGHSVEIRFLEYSVLYMCVHII